jgi:hypothetical protein
MPNQQPIESNIFDYVKHQEALYKMPVPLNEKWNWSMRDHILTTILYTNSQLWNGRNEFTPVMNITRPILNLQHRTEEIEVKDVQIYVDVPDKYHLSFLVRKYHDDVFTVENNIDDFFNELNVSRIDMGAGLCKQLNKACPEVVRLESIAFCDQTDILSGPLAIEHYYSPDQLLEMGKFGWGDPKNGATASLKDVIRLSRNEKTDNIKNSNVQKTPGKYTKVYEIHGNLPKKFTNPEDDSGDYENRLFIVCFYQKSDNQGEGGIVLYTAPETISPFKLIKRTGAAGIYGRALDFGGAEELFEAQVWTNYAVIRQQGLLDATSKVILQSDDPTITTKQKVRDMENLAVVDYAPGSKGLSQVDTVPRSMVLFDQYIAQWNLHAKDMGAAQDPIQGKNSLSGTPFESVKNQVAQSQALHDYRRGIYARFLEDVYRDWIIPHIQKKIVSGTKFLSELSLPDLQFVADALVTNQTNDFIKDRILKGIIPTDQEIDQFKQNAQTAFQKKGNRHFIEILKGEFKDIDLGVKVNIANKSKDLSGMVDKLTNVFRTIIASPYILQAPAVASLFNKIIEAAGLDPIDLSNFKLPRVPAMRMTQTVAFKDMPPDAQKAMLEMAGYEQETGPTNAAPAVSGLGAQQP